VLRIADVACAENAAYQSGKGVLDADATDHLAGVQVLRQNALASGPARGLNDQRAPQRYLGSPRRIDRSEHQRRIDANHIELRDPAYWCATASGQTPGEILQRLALRLDTWLDEPGPPPEPPGHGD
jgi:hypothetical protein